MQTPEERRAKRLARCKAYYYAHRDSEVVKRREYYQRVKHREAEKRRTPSIRAAKRIYNAKYHLEHRDKFLQRMKDRTKALKREVLKAYGNKCACCGETTEEFLSLDHPNGDGYAHRRRVGSSHQIYRELRSLGFPPGYRILCMNCNHSLGIHGYCPHTGRREDQYVQDLISS